MRTVTRLTWALLTVVAVPCAPAASWAAPAYRVRDINPGAGHGITSLGLTDVNGMLFFVAADDELWKSDGTEAGTAQVKEIRPGGLGAIVSNLTAVGGVLYFGADDGAHGYELWKSDGTGAGTVMVKDLNPGGQGFLGGVTVAGGTVYFVGNDGVHGWELWKTDGTVDGTVMVKDIYPDAGVSSTPGGLASVGGKVFFQADDGISGRELWMSDGTPAGTLLVKDLHLGPNPSNPRLLGEIAAGVALFFADDGLHGSELWRTDGTFFGTSQVADLNPAPGPGCTLDTATVFGGALFFSANCGPAAGGLDLWKSDGTAAGTVLFDLNPGSAPAGPRFFTVAGERLFFVATSPSRPASLFVSDGTVGGTYELYDSFFSYGPTVSSLGSVRGRVFASAAASSDLELWTTNGRLYGTYPVQDINPTGSGAPQDFTASGGRLFFIANDGVSGFELWATDVLFDNGFERTGILPDFEPWSSHTSGCSIGCDLSFAIPALDGAVAMQVNVNDTDPLFVQDDTPDGESEYHARFLFDPNGFDPGEAQGRHRTRILLAFSDQPQRRLLTLVLARNNGAYRIILRTRRDDGTTMDLPGVPITDAPHALEVAWKRASGPGAGDGTAELWIDDVLVGTLTGVDNDTGAIDFVRLGAMSIKTGASGALIYDRFESRRFRYVGPEVQREGFQ